MPIGIPCVKEGSGAPDQPSDTAQQVGTLDCGMRCLAVIVVNRMRLMAIRDSRIAGVSHAASGASRPDPMPIAIARVKGAELQTSLRITAQQLGYTRHDMRCLALIID
jgi:hypothetical protein